MINKKLRMYKQEKDLIGVLREQTVKQFGKIIVTQKRNNFHITVTENHTDKVICTASTGTVGYAKSERKNINAYSEVMRHVLKIVHEKKKNLKYFSIRFINICPGQDQILNECSKIKIWSIENDFKYPENGCKLKKRRRL